jgi:hypothetical protein
MTTGSTWFKPTDDARPDYRPVRNAMTMSYPIVAQYELDDPVKRGPLKLGKRRERDEIPKLKPHEVLIWRVGNRYVIDRRELRAHDDTVVRASSVSVVSVRPGTEVEVSFPIDSQDGQEFTVKVTFICSVVDPVVVVRDGQVNAADALLAYLRGYQDLFSLGLAYPIAQINQVRTKMTFQVKSYMTLRPPKIPGIQITSATVQMETPAVMAGIGELAGKQLIAEKEYEGEARLDARRQEDLLGKAAKMKDASHDARSALGLAYADGGMSSQQLAEQVQQIDEARQQRKQLDRMAATTRRYELDGLHAQWQHEETMANREWDHKQLESKQAEDREDRRNQLSANLELLKMFADQGYLDTYNADIEDMIRRIRGDQPGPQVTGGGQQQELTDGQADDDH